MIDINSVKELIESKPKGFFNGIITIDFAGLPVNMEEFRKLADTHSLWIIEDACHAPGGYFIDSKSEKNFVEIVIMLMLVFFLFIQLSISHVVREE